MVENHSRVGPQVLGRESVLPRLHPIDDVQRAVEGSECLWDVRKGLHEEKIYSGLSKHRGQCCMFRTRSSRGEIRAVAVRLRRDASGDSAVWMVRPARDGQIHGSGGQGGPVGSDVFGAGSKSVGCEYIGTGRCILTMKIGHGTWSGHQCCCTPHGCRSWMSPRDQGCTHGAVKNRDFHDRIVSWVDQCRKTLVMGEVLEEL